MSYIECVWINSLYMNNSLSYVYHRLLTKNWLVVLRKWRSYIECVWVIGGLLGSRLLFQSSGEF